MNQIRIGLFGFGCVGQGLYHVLHETKGIKAEIVKIAVKDRTKKRLLPNTFFTFEKEELLNNPSINLIVELIDDAEEAYTIVKEAIIRGKNVVTANKKMLALHLEELIALQQKHGVSLLYEAAACGSIPIIRNLEEYYDNDLLSGVSGIFNGSTNYILSQLFNEKSDYASALRKAQDLGFAESNPSLDVEAYDPLYKLILIAAHSFGILLHPNAIFNFGITTLGRNDLQYALEKQRKYKLVARIYRTDDYKVTLFVMPQLIASDNYLYFVENEYNAVNVQAAFSDKQLLIGKGAGGHPTGAAVLSDIAALAHEYKYEYKKFIQKNMWEYTTDVSLKLYISYKNEEILAKIGIDTVYEKFQSNDFSYLIASIKLSELIRLKNYLIENDVFIALVEE